MDDSRIKTLARTVRDLPADADFDLAAEGIQGREAYLAFVAAWKRLWHDRVAACREARSGMRVKGDVNWVSRAQAQSRRADLRHELRGLHRLRCRAKAAARRAVQQRRLAHAAE